VACSKRFRSSRALETKHSKVLLLKKPEQYSTWRLKSMLHAPMFRISSPFRERADRHEVELFKGRRLNLRFISPSTLHALGSRAAWDTSRETNIAPGYQHDRITFREWAFDVSNTHAVSTTKQLHTRTLSSQGSLTSQALCISTRYVLGFKATFQTPNITSDRIKKAKTNRAPVSLRLVGLS